MTAQANHGRAHLYGVDYRSIAGILVCLAATLSPLAANAGQVFCDTAQPLDPDEFEVQLDVIDPGPDPDDDSIDNAKFVEVPSQNFRTHTFHADGDEDWVMFEGRASDPLGPPIVYQVQATNLGNGILLRDTGGDLIPDEGTGVRLELLDASGDPVTDPIGDPVDSLKPGGSPSVTECGVATDPMSPVFVEFEVPTDETYFIRISQCRNAPELSAAGLCIPDDARYDFQIGYSTGLDAGELSGVVTDAVTGQPIVYALIDSLELNNFTFSLPGYSDVPDGAYALLDTVERNSSETIAATVTMAPGYQPATVEFMLAPGMTTNCDVVLTPAGAEIPIFKNGFESVSRLNRRNPKGVSPPDCSQLSRR